MNSTNYTLYSPQALSDSQLIAALTGIKESNVKKQLITCGGELKAMNEIKTLSFACEYASRYLAQAVKEKMMVDDSEVVKDYLRLNLSDEEQEVFCILFLDNRHRLLAFEKMFYGTIDSCAVHPREVVKKALAHNSAAIILAHNHPSGVTEPSQADINITQTLISALGLIDVRVLDHFVVGDSVTSMAEVGLM